MKTLAYLEELRAVANTAVEIAKQQKNQFACEPVNWGDLHCVAAEKITGVCEGELFTYYRVRIEECGDSATKLQNFIQTTLNDRGYTNVEVDMEW